MVKHPFEELSKIVNFYGDVKGRDNVGNQPDIPFLQDMIIFNHLPRLNFLKDILGWSTYNGVIRNNNI